MNLLESSRDENCCGESKQNLRLKELNSLAGNDRCVDCSTFEPDWASVSHGTLICIECAGKHRGLGVHISVVKSLTLDDWRPEQIENMRKGGNQRFEEYMKINNITLSSQNIESVYNSSTTERYRTKLDPGRNEQKNNKKPDLNVEISGACGVKRPPVWISDDVAPSCMVCNGHFTLLWRKHHCRKCGKIVCEKCGPRNNTLPIPEWGFNQPVRHCKLCFLSPSIRW
mmetsp:Transcript_40534/g.53350  ORF Transcript_40534/g.53350 Transcript_40534/m.53350 type:complete len:227 (-) Transcript_40534:8-688(-)